MRMVEFDGPMTSHGRIAVWPDQVQVNEHEDDVTVLRVKDMNYFVDASFRDTVKIIERAMYDVPDEVVDSQLKKEIKGEERENREAVSAELDTCGFCGEQYHDDGHPGRKGLCWKCHEAGREI